MKKILAGAAVGLTLALAAACGNQAKPGHPLVPTTHHTTVKPAITTHDIEVQLEIQDLSVSLAKCDTSGTDYDDITNGVTVTLYSNVSTVLGTAGLSEGTQENDAAGTCAFTAHFSAIPDVSGYTVTIADRGKVSASRDELAGNGWVFGLHLGDDLPSSDS